MDDIFFSFIYLNVMLVVVGGLKFCEPMFGVLKVETEQLWTGLQILLDL